MKTHLIKGYIKIYRGNRLTSGIVCSNCDNSIEQLGAIKKIKNKRVCTKCKKEICDNCFKKWLK